MVHDRSSDGATASFAGTPESVRDARRFVREALAAEGEDAAGDAALLTSELATNAVIHAGTDFRITVRRVDGGGLRVEVHDGSTATARRCRYSPTSGTGRGLGMVEDLAESWGVETDGEGKTVWFTLRPGPALGADDDSAVSKAVPEVAPGADGEPDLDAILADLGGWEDDDQSDAALRRAA